MVIQWISYFCFFIAALIHIGLFILESYFYEKPDGYKYFKVSQQDHEATKLWAFNQGFYNLFLAIGMIIGLYYVNRLQIQTAGVVVSLFGFFMIVAGVVLIFSSKRKLLTGALFQIVPPLVGFFFLSLHIMDKLGVF